MSAMHLLLLAFAAAVLAALVVWRRRPREVWATHWEEHDDGYGTLPWPQ